MPHDLIIRNGTVVDGTGADAVPRRRRHRRRPDHRRSATSPARPHAQEIDATGLVVSPGFVDLHTHLDAQVAWDPLMTSSSWHGVTTVLMGNCGVTFAPVAPDRPGLPRRDDGERRGHPSRRDPRRAELGLDDLPGVPRRRRADGARRSTSSAWSVTARCATTSWASARSATSRRRRPSWTGCATSPRSRSPAAPSGSRRRASSCTPSPTAGTCPARSPRSTSTSRSPTA